MKKITACLWFDHQAEEAMNFYVSVFKNARAGRVVRYAEGAPRPAGTVMTASFELDGMEFVALNGGPEFKFTEAVSFQIPCADQAEVDRLWNALSEGGETSECGWLKDRYGLSWQVVPTVLTELMADPDPARASRVTQAMLKMKKIDIAAIKAAAG